MKIEWTETTRNCHTGRVDGHHVVSVERLQKHRRDGTKHDWEIVTLGEYWAWNKTFTGYDPRDLDSTKSAAEARVRFAIDTLYNAIHSRIPKLKTGSER